MSDQDLFSRVKDILTVASQYEPEKPMTPFQGFCIGSAVVARSKGDLDVGNYMDQLAAHDEFEEIPHPAVKRLTHTQLLEEGLVRLSLESQEMILSHLPPTVRYLVDAIPSARTKALLATYRVLANDFEE